MKIAQKPTSHPPHVITHPEKINMLGRVPKGFWKDERNCRNCFEWLGKQLGIRKQEDWYKKTSSEVAEKGGNGLLQYFGSSLSFALASSFPELTWQVCSLYLVVCKNNPRLGDSIKFPMVFGIICKM
jgi:hypothetical protein